MAALVQSIGSANTTSSVTSLDISVSKTVTVGDTIIVGFARYSTVVPTITDNLGNTYTEVGNGQYTSPTQVRMFSAPVTVGGTLTYIRASWSPAGSYISLVADEFSGLGSVSDAGSTSGSDTSMEWATGTATIPANGAMVGVAFAQNPRTLSAGSASGSPSTTITLGTALQSPNDPNIAIAYALAGGSTVTTFTGSTNNDLATPWVATGALYTATAASDPGVTMVIRGLV